MLQGKENIKVTKVVAPEGGVPTEKTNKANIKPAIIDVICILFKPTNHTPLISSDIMNRLRILGQKPEARRILKDLWFLPPNVDKDKNDILPRMKRDPTVEILV